MRQVDKSKLYVGMSLQERAKLAFKFTASNDEAGLDNILATIPKKTHVMNDPSFSMRSTSLYHTAVLWGFEYQKQQGLSATFLGMLALIDENTKDFKLKRRRNESLTKLLQTKDNLEILFSLLNELDKSHGLDAHSVYGIAEVRCIAAWHCVLDSEGDLPLRSPSVLIDPDTKHKNQACEDYYKHSKELLLVLLNQYDDKYGNSC